MQAAKRAPARPRMIVLDELDINACVAILATQERLDEEPSVVAMDLWLEKDRAVEPGRKPLDPHGVALVNSSAT